MIYMSGDLRLGSNTSINPDGLASDLMIFSKGDEFIMGTSVDIHVAFYGPETDISMGNGCNFYGSILANTVEMDNSSSVHYDRALSDFAVSTTGEMIMIAWKEL